MKFQQPHYESLKSSIVGLLNERGITIDDIKTVYKDNTETLMLWDVFWNSKWTTNYRDHYNTGNYDDSHITTALRAIFKELDKQPMP